MGENAESRRGALVRAGEAAVAPLYPAARLIKGAVLDAEATRAAVLRDAGGAAAAGRGAAATGEKDLAALVAALREETTRLQEEVHRELPRAALSLARRVLDVEFALRPERVVDLVRATMRGARTAERLAVHLHPHDLPLVERARDSLSAEAPYASEIRFLSDPELPRHSIRIETEMGKYIAGLSEGIRRLEDSLLRSLAREGDRP
jgi:flagellar biosynthesis/type III secretory pathway protein FliH